MPIAGVDSPVYAASPAGGSTAGHTDPFQEVHRLSCIGLLWILGACARTQPAPAEHGQNSVDSARVWRDAHLLATGSSHKVMVDRPAVVVEAIRRMLDRVQRAR